MAHDHAHHNHHHNHSHGEILVLTDVNNALVIGIIFNFIFVIIEVISGLQVHALSLLSDAGHNLADVGSLALSLLAFRLLKVKSSAKYTYGYRKTSILAALFNAMILLVSIGAITYEAIHRFFNPQPLPGKTIAVVAGIGIIINTVTALLFLRNKDKDINIKSAYLHLISDAMVSAGLVIGGVIISFTNWFWLDPLLSIIIAIVIVLSTWNLLQESLRLSLDGVPKGINLEEIKKEALQIEGIKEIHHIHVWALSTNENAMTGHLVFDANINKTYIKAVINDLKHKLQHMNIQHTTIETEFSDDTCTKSEC